MTIIDRFRRWRRACAYWAKHRFNAAEAAYEAARVREAELAADLAIELGEEEHARRYRDSAKLGRILVEQSALRAAIARRMAEAQYEPNTAISRAEPDG